MSQPMGDRVDRLLERVSGSHLAEQLLGLAGAVQLVWAIVAVAAAIPDNPLGLRAAFATGAAALVASGLLTLLRRREDLATGILAALTAASFALSLAEFTIRDPSDATRYNSLWIPCALALILGAVRLAAGGWRTR